MVGRKYGITGYDSTFVVVKVFGGTALIDWGTYTEMVYVSTIKWQLSSGLLVERTLQA